MGRSKKKSRNPLWGLTALGAGAAAVVKLLGSMGRKSAASREGGNGSRQLAIRRFQQRSHRRRRRAKWMAAGWSMANVGVALARRDGRPAPARQFHDTNLGWNVLTGVVTAIRLAAGERRRQPTPEAGEVIRRARRRERRLWIKQAINFGGLGAGILLRRRAAATGAEPSIGRGSALVLQNSVAALLDGILLGAERRHRRLFELKMTVTDHSGDRPLAQLQYNP